MSDIIIRPETPADWPAAEAMVRRAFWNLHWPGCNEHLLVRVLHESVDLLPAFSRVAEMDGQLAVRVFELALPAALDAFPADAEKPRPGDIVRYRPGRDGKAHITRVCENLWRE